MLLKLMPVPGLLVDLALKASVPSGIEAQTRQVLANVDQILTAADSGRDRVLQMRIYVSDIQHWDTVNRVYAEFFGAHKPARAIVPTRELHFGCLLEVEATARPARKSSRPWRRIDP